MQGRRGRSADALWRARISSATGVAGILIALGGVFLFLGPVQRASAATGDTRNEYFLVIDTSKSMVGFNGSKDIFGDVKKSVSDYIGALDEGNTTVYIYPFAKGLTTAKPYAFAINSPADKKAAQRQVAALKATGTETWIYQALGAVLNKANAARKADPKVTHVQTIFLFTDGLNNGPVSLSDTLRKFKVSRGENPYLFLKYITLGTSADSRWNGVSGVQVQRTPSGQAPQLLSVRVRPTLLDLGSMKTVKTVDRTVEIAFDSRLQGKQIALEIERDQAEASGALITIAPASLTLRGTKTSGGFSVLTQKVTFTVANTDTLDESAVYGGGISLSSAGTPIVFSPGQIRFQFNVAPRSAIELTAPDRDKLSAALGVIDPYKGKAPAERSVPVRLVFNDRAQASGAYVRVHLTQAGGPESGLAQLVGPDGKATDSLQVGPEAPQFAVKVVVPAGAEVGDFSYQVVIEPHAAQLDGKGLQPAVNDASSFPVTFTVPKAPESMLAAIVRWGLWLLGAAILLVIILFVLLVVKTGSGPARLFGLILRKLSPTMLDARLEVTKPESDSAMIELTGQKSIDVGLGTAYLGYMPFVVRIEPEISVTEATDALVARVMPDGAGAFTVRKATADFDEPGVRTQVADGDIIRVEGVDGTLYELVIHSFRYLPV